MAVVLVSRWLLPVIKIRKYLKMAKYKGGDLRNISDNISRMKTRGLLKKLNRINKRIESGNLSGRNLTSQQKVKERLERQIQDMDKKSAGMLAAAPSSPVVKAVNQAERIAASNRASAGLSDRDKAKARIVTGRNNKDTLSKNPDVFPETGNQRTARMGQPTARMGQPKTNNRTFNAITPKPSQKFSGLMAGSPPLPNTPRGSDTPSRATKLNQTVDEYAEAFASPDASKMYDLSEKNRRKDMNMLERGLDSIFQAGERASAERRKQGKSDFDMNEDVYGMKRGGRLSSSKKNKTKGRKRAARRGFGVETRGS